jgi:hypothetical protein
MGIFILYLNTMKRIGIPMLALFAAFGLFLVSSALPASASELFWDVKSPLLREAVLDLAEREVLDGYPDGTFQPDRVINRAEALKIVFNARQMEASEARQISFSDVKESDWFSPFVKKALRYHIIQGYPDGTYKPFQEVSRADFLKIAFLSDTDFLFPRPDEQIQVAKELTDVGPHDWFLPYVTLVEQLKLMNFEAFRPHQGMTRGEAALLLSKYLKGKEGRQAELIAQSNVAGCSMCVAGVDLSQYAWAHWEALKIEKGKLWIGSQEFTDRFIVSDFDPSYLYSYARPAQMRWIIDNTPHKIKHRFDEFYPDYYRRAIGLQDGVTWDKDNLLQYVTGYSDENPIRTIDGHRLVTPGVDTLYERHLRTAFSNGPIAKINPERLDFHVWKNTDKGKEGMYSALIRMQWYGESASL